MTLETLNRVRLLERLNLERPQIPVVTHHLIHAGMYFRTILLPTDSILTGALIKIATVLIVSGDVGIYTGEHVVRWRGYHVLPASPHRKQVMIAYADTNLTMGFPTKAGSVEAAEAEFTDEAEMLFSRHGENVVHITGE